MMRNIMANVKTNISDKEAEILAWIIASEGSIGISQRYSGSRSAQGFNLAPQIQIVNTEIDYIQKTLKMIGNDIKYCTVKENYHLNHKERYTIIITKHDDILKLMKFILPYLPIKCAQALLMKEFCQSRLTNHMKPYTEREIEICNTMRKLNKRGLK